MDDHDETEAEAYDAGPSPSTPGGAIKGWGLALLLLSLIVGLSITLGQHDEGGYLVEPVTWADSITTAAIIVGPFVVGALVLLGIGAAVRALSTADDL